MALVIAIAGVPGSGKSTVAAALVQALGDAVLVPMDAYERMTRLDMRQLADWAARGADFDELPIPLLDEHLAALKAGQAVADPASGRPIAPARHIVLETQFGRAHAASGRHIDLLAWLDTPADVALARTLRRAAGEAAAAPEGELRPRVQWIAGYLDNYLALVQRLVAQQRERVRPGADLVLDGCFHPQVLAGQVQAAIAERFGAVA